MTFLQYSVRSHGEPVLLMHPPALMRVWMEPASLLPNTGRTDSRASKWQVNWLEYKFVYTGRAHMHPRTTRRFVPSGYKLACESINMNSVVDTPRSVKDSKRLNVLF